MQECPGAMVESTRGRPREAGRSRSRATTLATYQVCGEENIDFTWCSESMASYYSEADGQ